MVSLKYYGSPTHYNIWSRLTAFGGSDHSPPGARARSFLSLQRFVALIDCAFLSNPLIVYHVHLSGFLLMQPEI